MTRSKFDPTAPHIKWFRKEQACFLKLARLNAQFSIEDVLRKTGIDVSLVEKAESHLQMETTLQLINLYGVDELAFSTWQRKVQDKIRELATQNS